MTTKTLTYVPDPSTETAKPPEGGTGTVGRPTYSAEYVESRREDVRQANERAQHYAGLVDSAVELSERAGQALLRGRRQEALELLEQIWELE